MVNEKKNIMLFCKKKIFDIPETFLAHIGYACYVRVIQMKSCGPNMATMGIMKRVTIAFLLLFRPLSTLGLSLVMYFSLRMDFRVRTRASESS